MTGLGLEAFVEAGRALASQAAVDVRAGIPTRSEAVTGVSALTVGATVAFAPNAPAQEISGAQGDDLEVMQRQDCKEIDGLKALHYNSRGQVVVKSLSANSRRARVRFSTANVRKCDKYGVRTITDVRFLVRGDGHKKWVTSANAIPGIMTGNAPKRVNRQVNLGVRCGTGDKNLLVRPVSKVTYTEFDTKETYKRTERFNPSYTVKLPC